jgi:hypothetical protein
MKLVSASSLSAYYSNTEGNYPLVFDFSDGQDAQLCPALPMPCSIFRHFVRRTRPWCDGGAGLAPIIYRE